MPDEIALNFLLHRLPVFIPPSLVFSLLKSKKKVFLALSQLPCTLCFMHLMSLKGLNKVVQIE